MCGRWNATIMIMVVKPTQTKIDKPTTAPCAFCLLEGGQGSCACPG